MTPDTRDDSEAGVEPSASDPDVLVLMDHVPVAGGTTVAAALMAAWATDGVRSRGVALGRMSPEAARALPTDDWTVLGGGGHRGRIRRLRRHLARTARRPAVILAVGEYPALIAVVVSALLPPRHRPVVVLAEHQPRSLGEIVAEDRPLLARPTGWLVRALRRRTAASICLSEEQRLALRDRGLLTGGRTVVITNPCVLPPARSALITARIARMNADGPIRLLSVGTINPAKGQDLLIRALGLLGDDYTLSVAGGDDVVQLRDLVAGLGLRGRVEFLGIRDDVAGLMDDHDVFVLPSRYESFGLVVIEALVRGMPVAATACNAMLTGLAARVPSMRLAPVEDAAALAGAVEELAGTPWTADELLSTARATASRHDPVTAARAHLDLFATVLGRELRPGRGA